MAVLGLYLEKNLLPPWVRLLAPLVSLLATGATLVAYEAGWAPLQRPAGATPDGTAPSPALGMASGGLRISRDEVLKGALPHDRLRGAVLDGFILDRADLHDLNAAGVSLREGRLVDADLRDTILRGADLTNADLRGACLDRSDLTGARIGGTKIDGAHLAGATPPALPRATASQWRAALVSPCPR